MPLSRIHPRALTALAAAALLCTAALAAPVTLDLPAQPLAESLKQLGRSAGLTLMVDAALLAGKTAPALRGTMEPAQALQQLLQGTGLRGTTRDGALVIGLEPAPRAASTAPTELSAITVSASRPVEPASAATTQTITREDLDRFPVTSPGDLLREVTGVTVANSRNGSSLDVNIRGMQGFGRVKILVDGTESTGSSYKGYGGETSQSYVDPELLGEVKVEKGPNSGPYGAGVVGGVVSMSTLTADDLIQDGKSYGLRVRGTWASNQAGGSNSYSVMGPPASGSSATADAIYRDVSLPGSTWNGSVAGAWRLLDDKLELVAGLSHRQSGNYTSGSKGDVTARAVTSPHNTYRLSFYEPGREVYNSSQDTDSVLLKAGLKLPNDQKISLGYSRLQSTFGEARSAGYAEYIDQLNLSSVDKKLYTAQYAWAPAGNPWIDLRVNVWASDSTGYQAADQRGIAASGQTHRAQWNDTQGRGLEAWNTSTLDLPPGPMTLKYGVTWMQEEIDVTPLEGSTYMDPSGERSLKSVFLQGDFQPADWLLFNAGIRREHYQVSGYGEVPSGIWGQITPLNIAHNESRTNPSFGITFQPWEAFQLFTRYSEGWRPPTVKETINGVTADSNVTRSLLLPEYTRSTETGVKLDLRDQWLPRDRFSAGLTFFDNTTANYMQGFAGEFVNADSARIRGLEFNLGYDMGTAFARWGFTRYDHVEFCGVSLAFDSTTGCFEVPRQFDWDPSMSGLYIPPKSQQTLTVGTRLLDRRLTLGARMTAARDFTVNDRALGGWRSYEVYDLFGSWRVSRQLNVNFSVENLTDRFYMEASTSAMLAIPSPGRTAKVSLTYTF